MMPKDLEKSETPPLKISSRRLAVLCAVSMIVWKYWPFPKKKVLAQPPANSVARATNLTGRRNQES